MTAAERMVGTFSETPPIELFRWVMENAFTGVMVLQCDEVKKSIVFEKSKPISARSNLKEESLGALLLAEGRLTQEQLSKSLRMIEDKEVHRQGEALIAMGLINHALLNELLRRQLMWRIQEVCSWTAGRYAMIPEFQGEIAPIRLDQNLLEVVFRGLVRKYKGSEEAQNLREDIKPVSTGGQGINLADLKLVGREMSLYRSITGIVSIKDMIAKARLEKNVALALLLALRDLGFLRLGEAEMPKPRFDERPKAPPPRASGTAPSAAAPSSAAPKKSKEATDLFMEVQRLFEGIENKNFYELLGVTRSATGAELKKAYFELAKRYHPDRLPAGMENHERALVERLFSQISEAHTMLTNEAAKKEYDAGLELEASGLDAEKANRILQSEVEFQKGQVLVRKGNMDEAVAILSRAIELYDREPEYSVYLGWALFRRASKTGRREDSRKGKQLIEKAVKENDKLDQGYYYLGLITKAEGNLDGARKHFMKTLALAPRHQEATSELRVLNMREEKKGQGAGGLKGLFRKKD